MTNRRASGTISCCQRLAALLISLGATLPRAGLLRSCWHPQLPELPSLHLPHARTLLRQLALQAVFARSSGNAQLRKLAYEVCKAASLSERDHQKLLVGIKSDLNSPDPSVTAAALDFLPFLPGTQLGDLLQIGKSRRRHTPVLDPAQARHALPHTRKSTDF